MQAQDKTKLVAGEYYLRGVMETGSGFQLKPDSSFSFFYSYGMLDRFGSGRWTLRNDEVILTSRARPAVASRLIESRTTPDDSITIVIKDNNEVLIRYVHCQVKTENGVRELKTNEEGIARFPKEKIDSIALLFQLCPDRFSSFTVRGQENYFVFGFEPWIVEVFFDGFPLHWEGRTFLYEKSDRGKQ